MDDIFNHISKVLKSVLDALFLDRPVRTALGALLGIGMFIFLKLATSLQITNDILAKSGLSEIHLVILGIFIIYLPVTIKTLISSTEFNEDIESGFKLIKKAKKEGLPEWQVNQMYIKLCEVALKNSSVNAPAIRQQDDIQSKE